MRILLVEDAPLLQHSLAATLREENYAVDTASDRTEWCRNGIPGRGLSASEPIIPPPRPH